MIVSVEKHCLHLYVERFSTFIWVIHNSTFKKYYKYYVFSFLSEDKFVLLIVFSICEDKYKMSNQLNLCFLFLREANYMDKNNLCWNNQQLIKRM